MVVPKVLGPFHTTRLWQSVGGNKEICGFSHLFVITGFIGNKKEKIKRSLKVLYWTIS